MMSRAMADMPKDYLSGPTFLEKDTNKKGKHS